MFSSYFDVRLDILDIMTKLSMKKKTCLNCGNELARQAYTYCSNMCQRSFEYLEYIKKWKSGDVSGLQGIGIVSRNIKKYLREKYGNKCVMCGWSKININTGLIPLVADHIDGNWKNNIENNLRLLCPNCDSLTSTYAGLNRGKGRGNRVVSKRVLEGRILSVITPK